MPDPCPNCGSPVPAEARFCMNCGQAVLTLTSEDQQAHSRLAAAAPTPLVEKMLAAELRGERKPVTAIFADVVGSTTLMETIDPEEWTAIINQAFDLMSQAVYRYEGTIAQLQGDAMLAFFGAPVAHEDDPERAVRAALDMIAHIDEYARQLQASQGIEFRIRAGINTGPVMVGNVGTDLRYEYTALGDAINVAARIQAAARPGTVLITSDTYRFVSTAFEVADLGPTPLKGKAEPVHAYEVLELKAPGGPRRGVAGLRSPMVGRDLELETLKQLLAVVRAGRGRTACVIGEPGIGKSRLVAELKSWALTLGEDLAWVEGRCLTFGRNFPYHLVLDVLRACIGVPPLVSDEETRLALEHGLAGLPPEVRADSSMYLAHLLSLPPSEADARRLAGIEPETLRTRYIGGMQQLLRSMAAHSPMVLICEDIHWADVASVEVFAQLLGLLSPLPILVCISSRPEQDAPGWRLVRDAREMFGEALTELRLAPLSEDDSKRLVGNLLEIESLPAHLREKIFSKAEGNPFFVEELIRVLIDHGAIVREDGNWVATGQVETVNIPDTLQGLLLARIDRLSEEAKHSLRVASVIGRQFQARVLERVLQVESQP